MLFQEIDRCIHVIRYLADLTIICRRVPDSVLGLVVEIVTRLTDAAHNNDISASRVERYRSGIYLFFDYLPAGQLFEKIKRVGMTSKTELFRVPLEGPGQSDI